MGTLMGRVVAQCRLVAVAAAAAFLCSANAQSFEPVIGVKASANMPNVTQIGLIDQHLYYETSGSFGYGAGIFLFYQPDWIGFQYELTYTRIGFEFEPSDYAQRLDFPNMPTLTNDNEYFAMPLLLIVDLHPSPTARFNIFAGPKIMFLSSATRTMSLYGEETEQDAEGLYESTVYSTVVGVSFFAEGMAFDIRTDIDSTPFTKQVTDEPEFAISMFEASIGLYF